MSRKFFNFPIIFLKIGPLRPRRRFSLAKQEKVWHNKYSVKRCPPESISRSAQAHNFIFGDVPKRLKGPHSKCGRSAQNRRESSNLSISAMRSASEKLVDLFPFYGETADRFCSMGATMSCSMAAADCFFVAYCRCP